MQLSDMITNRDIKVFLWDKTNNKNVASYSKVRDDNSEYIEMMDGSIFPKPQYKISVQFF